MDEKKYMFNKDRDESLSLSFPFDVIKGAAGYYTNVYSSYMEIPKQFLFLSYLTCLGAVLSKKIRLKSALRTQPRLYTVLVGESAFDRKSTAIEYTVDHFEKIIESFVSCWGLGSAEGLQKVLRKKRKELEEKEIKEFGFILAFDELKAFVNKCKIESSVLLPCINTLFESNKYENHTQKASLEINDAQISLLGASTVQTYETIYNSTFTSIGFPNRIFLVIGTALAKDPFPEEIPRKKITVMEANLKTILNRIGDEKIYDLTEEAKELWHEYYMSINRSSVHSRRLDTYGMRLMMILAANRLKKEIDEEIILDTVKLLNWQYDTRKIYDPIDADTKIARMEESIRRKLFEKGPLQDRELKQATSANRTGLWIYNNALKNLKSAQEIGWSNEDKKHFLIEDKY